MRTIEAVHRSAAGARNALVAIGVAHIAKISTTRTLQDVAAEGSHVPQLRTCGKLERVGDHRIVALDFRIGGDIRHPRQRAEPEVSAAQIDRGPPRGQRIDVDDSARLHHVELHQIDQGGAAGERLNRCCGRRSVFGCRNSQRLHRRRWVGCPLICERPHGTNPSRWRRLRRPVSPRRRCWDRLRSDKCCRSYIRGFRRRYWRDLLSRRPPPT
jgi:hypothetical protein